MPRTALRQIPDCQFGSIDFRLDGLVNPEFLCFRNPPKRYCNRLNNGFYRLHGFFPLVKPYGVLCFSADCLSYHVGQLYIGRTCIPCDTLWPSRMPVRA